MLRNGVLFDSTQFKMDEISFIFFNGQGKGWVALFEKEKRLKGNINFS
jgi:hypothetical protein